jgi:hypothetical protein
LIVIFFRYAPAIFGKVRLENAVLEVRLDLIGVTLVGTRNERLKEPYRRSDK